MNVVLKSKERTLLSVSPEELVGIRNALNEICNDRRLAEAEFQTRLGVTREFLVGFLNQMPGEMSGLLKVRYTYFLFPHMEILLNLMMKKHGYSPRV